ncbi:MAG: hypothetical protein U0531_17060 [Dehalococcoidia bacterium]
MIAERLAEEEPVDDTNDLTLRDLRIIAESFKRSLRAIYHQRIEYQLGPGRRGAATGGPAPRPPPRGG